jgi:hypothetical protein
LWVQEENEECGGKLTLREDYVYEVSGSLGGEKGDEGNSTEDEQLVLFESGVLILRCLLQSWSMPIGTRRNRS